MKYRPAIVTAWLASLGIPAPEYEHAFHPTRKWRFDLAWPAERVFLEVDGGIWIGGGHNRGAQLLKDWEKRNAATVMGWRGLWCQPKDLCTLETADTIRAALAWRLSGHAPEWEGGPGTADPGRSSGAGA